MATIVLGAMGAAAGAAIGGTVVGLSSAVIGRAIGSTLGRALDQRLLGSGSDVVETGRVDRFRLTGASEGVPVAQVYGRMRVGGQVIWATRFLETVTTSGGGKGAAPKPRTRSFSYSVSLALALCEGEILRVGRVWADGAEVARDDLNMRVYTGGDSQTPDPKIEAVEGQGNAPAYRGTAYVVLEDLELAPFGNRVPQLTFEVMRPATGNIDGLALDLNEGVQGVALVPGTGEYALATTPVHYSDGPGLNRTANVNSPSGKTDFATSLEALDEELPNCRSTSLVVSWFGDDLRAPMCQLKPKVEQSGADGVGMPWSVSGVARSAAGLVPGSSGRPVYGGTPTDASVYEAINHLNNSGKDVVFYPFILMEQLEGNGLLDPWSGAPDQPELPWRGRITLTDAPGRPGSTDGTLASEAEVAGFFGAAAAADFAPVYTVQTGGAGSGGTGAGQPRVSGISYNGPPEWSYRRFILHYAHLCAESGGVSAFCIGSEMRGLTQIRGADGSFPAVSELIRLAADVRAILGPETKIGYAADWSEYFGYHPQDGSGDVYFHLDRLWADANIDFIGIDNYMPLSDWREGEDHLDANWGAIYNLDYLKSNIAGGEGFDWYYHSREAREAQIRTAITDGAYGKPWVFRYKDLKSWWSELHHNRSGGVQDAEPTEWRPQSKPVWFTEFGCAAINKGANQPNKFLDPKSSESGLPRYSDGSRDELMQLQYLRAMFDFWGNAENNPVSVEYDGTMVDIARAHVWAWDARPFPSFPNNLDLWSDGENYARGHWLNGRTGARSLDTVVAEICAGSGVSDVDVSALYGYLRGFTNDGAGDARRALQPLMLGFGFDAVERGGRLIFQNRDGRQDTVLDPEELALTGDQSARIERARAPQAETAGRVRLSHVEADADYATRSAEAIFPDEESTGVSQSELPIALTGAEARAVVERWLAESRVARDTVRFALPPSALALGAGDVVQLPESGGYTSYRIDFVEQSNAQIVEAVRIEPNVYVPSDNVDDSPDVQPFTPSVPVFPVFLDLPLIAETDAPHAPYLAVAATPWPGSVALYSSANDSGYTLNTLVTAASIVGVTESPIYAARTGLRDNGRALRVRLSGGSLASVAWDDVLNGANLAAIGDGSSGNWELFQFESANLVAADTYDLTGRLRGQLGSDAIMPAAWPVGSMFVLLDGVAGQIDMPSAARDLARHYRIGPARRSNDDPSYIHQIEAFKGIGLRPYSPVHLRASYDGSGALVARWIRRTRIDGDSWSSFEVPLGEDREQYLLRVRQEGLIVRETQVALPEWAYPASLRAADGVTAPYQVEVAQLSDRFGAGPFSSLNVDA